MKKIILFLFIIGALLINFIACKKNNSCESCTNKPPIADAGADQVIILPTDSVLLDARNSNDPDKNISTYQWTKVSGPASVSIRNPVSSLAVAKGLVAGIYLFELKVTDDRGLFAKDTLKVIVEAVLTNHTPLALAGPDQLITLPNNIITVNGGASTDPDNNITSYYWGKVSGPQNFSIVSQLNSQSQITSLTEGIYEFELTVTDATGLYSKDTIKIIVIRDPQLSAELTFTNLEWSYWHDPNDPSYSFDEIYLSISDTSNAIPNSITPFFAVWVKKDSYSGWEKASNTFTNGNCTAPYWYSLSPASLLIELCYPWDMTLVGRKAEVKVVF